MYTISEFANLIGVTPITLRRWHASGKLVPEKLNGKHRRYSEEHLNQVRGIKKSSKLSVIYCRESTRQQKNSLDRQEALLKEFAIKSGISIDRVISEFGSGMNCHRKGLQELISLISTNSVENLIIYYQDRLVRFGFEIIEYLCKIHGTNLIIVDKTEHCKTREEEFAEDLISIIHYFSMKLYGSRSYKAKHESEIL